MEPSPSEPPGQSATRVSEVPWLAGCRVRSIHLECHDVDDPADATETAQTA